MNPEVTLSLASLSAAQLIVEAVALDQELDAYLILIIIIRGKAFFIDSEVSKGGEWKTKEPQLISYQELAIDLIKRFGEIT